MYLLVFDFLLLLLLLFETVSCCVTQTGLKLTIFVDQLPEYWDYRCVYSYAENMELRGERLTELTLDREQGDITCFPSTLCAGASGMNLKNIMTNQITKAPDNTS